MQLSRSDKIASLSKAQSASASRENFQTGLVSGSTGRPLSQIIKAFHFRLSDNSPDTRATVHRLSTHLMVIVIIIAAIGLSQISWWQHRPGWLRPLKFVSTRPPVTVVVEADTPLALPAQLNDFGDDTIIRAAVPKTIILDRASDDNLGHNRTEILTYSVEAGDTVSGIAAKFGLAPETITWANPSLENNPDLLQVDQELVILPVDGVYHQVGDTDTVESIAAAYQIAPSAIINFPLNVLNPDNPIIQPGQWLVAPGGTKPYVPRAVTAYGGLVPEDATTGTGVFAWPTSGIIFQGYWSAHPALDIAGWLSAPVLAADSGYVIAAGWDDTGYGNAVVIDHGNGFQTLYAHLQAVFVNVGDEVAKGQQIAGMGSSGNSTGPHTHFEIRQGTVQRNPIGFLP
jgi:murein DD-endopeptidase MepM/ murein hydrolase activator NlpD